jgi:branched-chain amino acid transport system permease protein
MPSAAAAGPTEPAIRWAAWAGYALAMLAAPLLWPGGLALAVLSQIGIAIIACLAFNMLLGQGGMLSFGHAVYSGLGGYFAMHALNLVAQGRLALPVSLIPLVGGAFGLLFALPFGYLCTRRAGTTFAMITLGVGELVAAVALMFPGFFGGEGGIGGNRVVGPPVAGLTFGPQIELYGLIAIYTLACTGAMYAWTHTPLGRMVQAVRDNPERAGFVGYNPRLVRWLAFSASGFFMGIAGGLAALNFEIVTAEVVGPLRSGSYLLFTLLGGAGSFIGPIIGAVLMVLALGLLSELTQAWLLYLGLVFTLMVMVVPGGVASLVPPLLRLASDGRLRPLAAAILALAGAAATALAGAAVMIESLYQLQLGAATGRSFRFLGLALDARGLDTWFGAAFALVVGLTLFELARRPWTRQWRRAEEEIEHEIGREGAA